MPYLNHFHFQYSWCDINKYSTLLSTNPQKASTLYLSTLSCNNKHFLYQIQEMELTKEGDKQLEDRTAQLGSKNMELVHQLRKLESQVKELQQTDIEKVK